MFAIGRREKIFDEPRINCCQIQCAQMNEGHESLVELRNVSAAKWRTRLYPSCNTRPATPTHYPHDDPIRPVT